MKNLSNLFFLFEAKINFVLRGAQILSFIDSIGGGLNPSEDKIFPRYNIISCQNLTQHKKDRR